MADETPDPKRGERQFRRWQAEIAGAQKDTRYKQWLVKSQQITDRYRDQRNKSATQNVNTKRYNILWANVQTLGPAVYGKEPKPIAERRFLDRDPSARLASMILERTLAFQMSIGGFHESAMQAIHKDYLLPGMGQMWVRYYPEFESSEVAKENAEVEDQTDEADDEGFGEVYDKLAYERLCFDYVYWRDFLWSPSRTWAEVPWVAKRCWLDYTECEEQFGEDIADRMTFGDPKNKDLVDTLTNEDNANLGKSKKAEVWEIWCKPERKVYFIAPDSPGMTLKEQDDPLNLEGFWPCPPPLFTTQTNDTIIPVPDYLEYQDQALELDDLTDRIDNVISAVRINGVYDSQWPALQRLLQKGQDNTMLPVDDWAKFTSEGGGIDKAISLVPIEPIVLALQTLTSAREQVLQDCYQITGISDIIRGQSDPNETATAQKIKANYATGRLGARQQHVADFCVNTIRIGAELIAEIFSDQSLRQMSGVDQLFSDQIRAAVESVPKPAPPQQSQQNPNAQSSAGPQGQMLAQPDPMQMWQQAKAQAANAKQQELEQQFQGALKILRSDKLRGFRVDIETDSTISDDLQNDKQAVREFVTELITSIQGAEQTLGAAPELIKPMGDTILWAMRKMRVGRSVEAGWEDAFDKLEKRVDDMKNQPPKPDPEMIKAQAAMQLSQVKAQAEQASSQADVQATQLRSQAETAKAQSELRVQEVQLQSEQAQNQLKGQIEALKLQLEAKTSGEQTLTDRQKAMLDYLKAVRVAEINAGVATNESQVDAQIQTMLGFATMAHEQQMQANEHAQQQDMAASQQEHDQTMQKTEPSNGD